MSSFFIFTKRKCSKLGIVCMFLRIEFSLENLEERRPIVFEHLREPIIPIRGSSCEETIKKRHTSGVPSFIWLNIKELRSKLSYYMCTEVSYKVWGVLLVFNTVKERGKMNIKSYLETWWRSWRRRWVEKKGRWYERVRRKSKGLKRR